MPDNLKKEINLFQDFYSKFQNSINTDPTQNHPYYYENQEYAA